MVWVIKDGKTDVLHVWKIVWLKRHLGEVLSVFVLYVYKVDMHVWAVCLMSLYSQYTHKKGNFEMLFLLSWQRHLNWVILISL